MPTKLTASEIDLGSVEAFLRTKKLKHLHARKRADAVILDAGTKNDPWPRARMRKVTKQWWTLDVADFSGRWEATPFRAPLTEILDLLANSFPWVLADAG